MRILAATILAKDPLALAEWYRDTLGMAVVEGEGAGASGRAGGPEDAAVEVGETLLCFTPAPPGERPVYHVAFDIRENKIGKARKWLLERGVDLIPERDSGEVTVHFKPWNAHAVYFRDPAGNIIEFIARHDLPTGNKRAWDVADDVLWISEVGLVVDSAAGAMVDLERRLGLAPYIGADEGFVPVGDEEGLLVIVERGRPWLPDLVDKAEPWPARIVVDAACVRTGAGRYGVAGANGVGYELVAVDVEDDDDDDAASLDDASSRDAED
jgi:catechol 2,3-dioxygenase-like lactoylglutathione lyase family enzyme